MSPANRLCRGMLRLGRGLGLATGGLMLLAGGGSAVPATGERPHIYAITHATAVTAPGRQIDDATLVLRDGLIEAVGAGLPVPPDAVEIDGTDRWLYPGLIDADSELGLGASGSGGAGGGGGSGGASPFGRRPETPPGPVHPLALIRPERRASDELVAFTGERERELEKIRNLGFTVVLVRPRAGILRGAGAAILLAADRPVAEIILRDDVAQHAAFERGRFGRGYPTSLMGTIAALRQVFLDTRRHLEWTARWETDPRGIGRPPRHAAFNALAPVLAGDMPLVFHTDDPYDTLKADELAREFGIELILSVASHEWEHAERLAATGRPLIVSLGFPDEPEVDDEDEALNVSRDELRRYLDAAAGPGRLHAAGVELAFTLAGLKNSADCYKQLRKIIAAGLPEEVALAALTTVPARLLGIERAVGTLEPGKIANIVVADGPLFAEESRLRRVFVDGVEHEIEVKEKPVGDPDAVVDPRGEWAVVFDFGARSVNRSWTIDGAPGSYRGTAETQGGTVSFDSVELAGNALTVVFPARGGRPSMEVTVIIEGDEFEGSAEMGPRTIEISGSRTRGPEEGRR